MAICPCHTNVYAMWAAEEQARERPKGVLQHQTHNTNTPGHMCQSKKARVLSLPGGSPALNKKNKDYLTFLKNQFHTFHLWMSI